MWAICVTYAKFWKKKIAYANGNFSKILLQIVNVLLKFSLKFFAKFSKKSQLCFNVPKKKYEKAEKFRFFWNNYSGVRITHQPMISGQILPILFANFRRNIMAKNWRNLVKFGLTHQARNFLTWWVKPNFANFWPRNPGLMSYTCAAVSTIFSEKIGKTFSEKFCQNL